MPDWKQIVYQQLGGSPISHVVVAELATHLEEIYEAERSRGCDDAAALQLTLQEVADWTALSAEIVRAKSEEDCMNHRTKSLWLPGMITLLGASALLALSQFVGTQPRLVWFGHHAMVFYWHWLVALPLFGALGAYLSKRAHGRLPARLAATLFPALVMLVTMSVILPWAIAIDGFSPLLIASFGVGLTNWVFLPGLALMFGASPFLREPRHGVAP